MALNKVTLTWDLTDLVEQGIPATLILVPTAQLTDATDHLQITEIPHPVVFNNGTGELPGVIACDNPNIDPSGWGYTVTVISAGQQILGPYNVFINYADGATQDLSTLTQVQSVTTMQGYMPLDGGVFAGPVTPCVVGVTDGPVVTVDASKGNLFRVTIAGNRNLTVVNGADGQLILVEVTQGAGGPWSLSYSSVFDFGNIQPQLSAAAGDADVFGLGYKLAAGKWKVLAFAPGY